MEKQVIQQGISYVVNNIALSYTTVSGIYEALNKPINDILDFSEAVAFLDLRTNSTTRRVALSVVLRYRHSVSHSGLYPPLIQDLHDAILTLASWYTERVSGPRTLLSPMSEGELVINLLVLTIGSIVNHDRIITQSLQQERVVTQTLQQPTTKQERVVTQTIRQPMIKQEGVVVPLNLATSALPNDEVMFDDDDGPVSEDVDNIEITGMLRGLREGVWKERIKQRNILVLDGRHANKHAKFLYWSGTVAYVRFKGEKSAAGIPIDRNVSVFYPKYNTPQWRE